MDSHTTRRTFLRGGLGMAGGAVVAGSVPLGSTAPAFALPQQATPKTPEAALKRLLAGNRRFVNGRLRHPRRDSVRRVEQAEGQTPYAIILSCADSRVGPEIIFDEGIGDLFPVRVAGNTAETGIVIGSLEYPAVTFGCVLLMVLGHSDCGAVKAAIDVVTKGATLPGDIPDVVAPIVPAVQNVQNEPKDQLLDAAIDENVRLQSALLSQNEILAGLVSSGDLMIVGADYNVDTGKVEVIE